MAEAAEAAAAEEEEEEEERAGGWGEAKTTWGEGEGEICLRW